MLTIGPVFFCWPLLTKNSVSTLLDAICFIFLCFFCWSARVLENESWTFLLFIRTFDCSELFGCEWCLFCSTLNQKFPYYEPISNTEGPSSRCIAAKVELFWSNWSPWLPHSPTWSKVSRVLFQWSFPGLAPMHLQ